MAALWGVFPCAQPARNLGEMAVAPPQEDEGKVWAGQVQWDGKVDTAQVRWPLQPTPGCERLRESEDTQSSEPR